MSATYGRLMTEEEKAIIENACINNYPKSGIWNLPEGTEEEQKRKYRLFCMAQRMIHAEVKVKVDWMENDDAAKRYLAETSLIHVSDLGRSHLRVLAGELRRSANWTCYKQDDVIIYRSDKGKIFIDDTDKKTITSCEAQVLKQLIQAVRNTVDREEAKTKAKSIFDNNKVTNTYTDIDDRENYLE